MVIQEKSAMVPKSSGSKNFTVLIFLILIFQAVLFFVSSWYFGQFGILSIVFLGCGFLWLYYYEEKKNIIIGSNLKFRPTQSSIEKNFVRRFHFFAGIFFIVAPIFLVVASKYIPESIMSEIRNKSRNTTKDGLEQK